MIMGPVLSTHNTGPWRVVITHPTDNDNWYIYNTQTGRYKKIGRVGAIQTNYFDVAEREADRRNRTLGQ